jgi:hypothetical protein
LASAAVAVLLMTAVTGQRGCASPSTSPVAAARAFVQAAQRGDKQAVWDLLGPRTREHLQKSAVRATEMVGGARRFSALDLLDVTSEESRYPQGEATLRRQEGSRAIVDVIGPSGHRDALTLVHEAGTWRVELAFGTGSGPTRTE